MMPRALLTGAVMKCSKKHTPRDCGHPILPSRCEKRSAIIIPSAANDSLWRRAKTWLGSLSGACSAEPGTEVWRPISTNTDKTTTKGLVFSV